MLALLDNDRPMEITLDNGSASPEVWVHRPPRNLTSPMGDLVRFEFVRVVEATSIGPTVALYAEVGRLEGGRGYGSFADAWVPRHQYGKRDSELITFHSGPSEAEIARSALAVEILNHLDRGDLDGARLLCERCVAERA